MIEGKSNGCVVAVDPGSSSGAIVVRTWELGEAVVVECYNMPGHPKAILEFFEAIKKNRDNLIVVCENVGAPRPGNSARASTTFAKHRGHLEMAFIALGLRVIWVQPQKWMRELMGDNYPKGDKNKKIRKARAYETAVERYPGVKVTKRQGDALAILAWYICEMR